MSRRCSPILVKRYPLRTVCDVWRVPRSSVYALAAASAAAEPTAKRGPKTAQSDVEVVALIRAILLRVRFTAKDIARCAPGCGSTVSTSAKPACCG